MSIKNKENLDTQEKEPNFTFTFLILGIVLAVPFGSVSLSFDFFNQYFYEKSAFYIPNAYFPVILLTTFWNLKYGERYFVFNKIRFNLTMILIMNSSIIAMIYLVEGIQGFYSLFVLCIIMAMNNGVFSPSSFGLASVISPAYLTSLSLGTVIGGTLFFFVRLLFNLIAGPNKDIYALRTGVTILYIFGICMVLLAKKLIEDMAKNDYIKEKIKASDSNNKVNSDNDKKSSIFEIFSNIKYSALSVFLITTASFSVFPAIIIKPAKGDSNTILILIGSNQIFGAVGVFISKSYKFFSEKQVLILCLIRYICVFIAILLCTGFETSYLSNYTINLLNCLALSFSHGYLWTCAMVFAPTNLKNEDKQKGGFLMSTLTSLGMTMGTIVVALIGYFNIV